MEPEESQFRDSAANAEARPEESGDSVEVRALHRLEADWMQDGKVFRIVPRIYFFLAGLTFLGILWTGSFVAFGLSSAETQQCFQRIELCGESFFVMVSHGIWLLVGLVRGILQLLFGLWFQKKVNYRACQVVAGALCFLDIPIGTVLGALTLTLLSRPAIQAEFQKPFRDLLDSNLGTVRPREDDYKRPEIIRKG